MLVRPVLVIPADCAAVAEGLYIAWLNGPLGLLLILRLLWHTEPVDG